MPKLTARFVTTTKQPGRHSDGDGLYLLVRVGADDAVLRSWVFRYRKGARGSSQERQIGLGSVKAVSLSDAREKAAACRRAVASGKDPREERQGLTFGEVADDYLASIVPGMKNAKHRAQWKMTLGDAYCKRLRRVPIDHVKTEDVLATLKPIWLVKPETAKRIQQRIWRVLNAAKVKGLRSGENPAQWTGHLDMLLARQPRLTRGHHAAMPWQEAPDFMAELRGMPSISARALEWTILTAVRTSETTGCRMDEIDMDAAVWTIPASRMKAGREHRVPLSPRAAQIAATMARLGNTWMFPGASLKRPISNSAMAELLKGTSPGVTVHGFRSTFRDWTSEATAFPHELAEMALAHTIKNATERAYRRGDMLERRREMMTAWERYLSGSTVAVRLVG